VYGFLLVFCSNVVTKTRRFWYIRLVSIRWISNAGYGSLKVIENDTIRSGTHDFLLTFHSSHRSIPYRFRDKRRFPSKIANVSLPPHVFNALAEGAPLGIGYLRNESIKLKWWGVQMVEKCVARVNIGFFSYVNLFSISSPSNLLFSAK